MSLLRNTATVAALTAGSRALGLVREILQGRFIGAGVEQSAFTAAFMLPNLARRLFGEGALTAAFVPVFKGELEADETLARARRLARAVLTTSMLILSAAAILGVTGVTACLGVNSVRPFLSEKLTLTLEYARLLLPYMMFICAAAFGMGVLNSFGKFAAAAAMPAVLNLGWIAALAALCFFPGLAVRERVVWVCVAILVAGFAQMAFMFRCMHRRGISPLPTLAGWRDPASRKVWRNMAIGCIGSGAVQINCMVDQLLALKASDWAAGVIGYADRLMELPLGIVGTAFGTVLLPTFAGCFARGERDGACAAFRSSVCSMSLLVIPAAAALAILAPEITGLIYRGGRFDGLAVLRVSRAVGCYSPGLFFFCLYKILAPFFQAQGDMRTPLRVATGMAFVNAALNCLAVFLLPVEWRHVGLAGSTDVCSALSCAILWRAAERKSGSLGAGSLAAPLAKILAASAAMALALVLLKAALGDFAAGGKAKAIAATAAFVIGGAAVYFGTLALAARELLTDAVRGFRRR